MGLLKKQSKLMGSLNLSIIASCVNLYTNIEYYFYISIERYLQKSTETQRNKEIEKELLRRTPIKKKACIFGPPYTTRR
jgi:hypothetical protein